MIENKPPVIEAKKDKGTSPHLENSNLKKSFGNLLERAEVHKHQLDLNLINTRLWMDELSKKYNRAVTIDTIPENEWEELLDKYDMFWFMGVHAPSGASKNHAQNWAHQYEYALPGLDKDKDVVSSPFSIPRYSPNPQIAKSWKEWDKMKSMLNGKGKEVILDFVPNHTALDNPWVMRHPEYYVQGSKDDYENNKSLFHPVRANDGKDYYLAHGKDPNYPEWADTLQLNYARRDVQEKMQGVLMELAKHSDGVRCDMAMLLDASTFIRTWDRLLSDQEKDYISQNEFWEKTIPIIKESVKEKGDRPFHFIAEAYWDKEELGKNFDFIYRKDFYDHLKKVKDGEADPESLTKHLQYLIERANNERHYRDVLFVENHDEERAKATFGEEASGAAAVLAGLIPDSIFLVNQGQPEGKEIRPPMQIGRWPNETPNENLKNQYEKLLLLKHTNLFENGKWSTFEIDALPPDIHAIRVEAPTHDIEHDDPDEYKLGAIVLVNFSKYENTGHLPQINKDYELEVQSLSEGVIPNPDMERIGGTFVKLKPWETQMVFYSKIN
ncbi:MAG: hypothetical protein KBC12_03440 [Candidatus Pacebacteria bacterium]|nr:hypothetical protein [Candidatus Paceibacterota bacterium]MBP9851309.1 hypothetical protein [Candidatus Paceibacterota bacterium]